MHEIDFLQDLAVVMLVAGLVTVLFHRLKQPVVLGYILAGLIIGPHTPPFPLVMHQQSITTMADIGVIFLMFSLGLHFSLRKLVSVGATAFIAATVEIVVMSLVGYGVGRLFGWGAMDSIFLGAMLSISSTTIIVKALQELGLTRERFAGLIFGILIVEDILAIAMLALLSGIAMTGSLAVGDVLTTMSKLTVFLTCLLVVGLLAVPGMLRYIDRFKSSEVLLITVLGLCFGVSLLAAKLGYSVALGAFLIGAIVAEAREAGKIEALVLPLRDMFSAVFFVAIGMMIDPGLIAQHAAPIAVITVLVIVGKVLTCSLGSFLAGNDTKTSLRVGMGVSQIGEFSFIIAQLGVSLHVTSEFLYPIVVAVSAITTLTTPYLIKASDPLSAWFDRSAPRSFTAYLNLYSNWLTRVDTHRAAQHQVRKLIRNWTLQLAVNMALSAGIFITAAWIGERADAWFPSMPPWTGGPRTVLWLAAVVLVLPFAIASTRKVRAAAMLMAELSVPKNIALEQTTTIRLVITNTILIASCATMLLVFLVLGSTLLPPWPVLAALGLAIVVAVALLWRSFIKVYATAQIALHQTLTRPVEPHAEHAPAIPAMLRDAAIATVLITDASPAKGRLIRQIQLRTQTGASIVAIERGSASIINPSPDEELQPGDRVLLLGHNPQVAHAGTLLTGEAEAPPETP